MWWFVVCKKFSRAMPARKQRNKKKQNETAAPSILEAVCNFCRGSAPHTISRVSVVSCLFVYKEWLLLLAWLRVGSEGRKSRINPRAVVAALACRFVHMWCVRKNNRGILKSSPQRLSAHSNWIKKTPKKQEKYIYKFGTQLNSRSSCHVINSCYDNILQLFRQLFPLSHWVLMLLC